MLEMRFVRAEFFGHPSKYHWEIWERKTKIGEITYKVYGKYVILGHLDIIPEYRKQHWGYKSVEYLMKKISDKKYCWRNSFYKCWLLEKMYQEI